MFNRKIVTGIILIAAIANLSFSQITVSILSFEDAGSSDKKQFIGKALSQMVTADLVAVDGVTIIDRSDTKTRYPGSSLLESMRVLVDIIGQIS